MSGILDEIRILLYGIWRRRWLAIGIAWAVCLLGWLVVAMIPNSYESQSRIYVQVQSILPSASGADVAAQQKGIDQVRATLTSQENLEKVVRRTDLANGLKTDQEIAAAAAGLRSRIRLVAVQENLFDIGVLWSDPSRDDALNARLPTQIVTRLIDIFVESAVNSDSTNQTLKFLDSQIADRGRRLADAEQRLTEFEQRFGGALPGGGSLSDRMSAGRAQIADIDNQLIAAQSALNAANAQLAGAAPTINSGGGPGALAAAQAEMAQARARGWTDSHPDMIALKAQIESLRAMGGNAGSTQAPNPLYMSLRAMQAEKQAAVAALSTRKAQIQNGLNALMAAQAGSGGEQSELARDYDVLREQYAKLLADRENVKLRGQVRTGGDGIRFNIIDPPSGSSIPTAPNRPLLLFGVLVVGIGAGVGAAFLLNQLQGTYPTAARLERATGLPVLGSITETLSLEQKGQRRQRLFWFAGATGSLVLAWALLNLVIFVQRGMMA